MRLRLGIWVIAAALVSGLGCKTAGPGKQLTLTYSAEVPAGGSVVAIQGEEAMFVPVRIGERELTFVFDTGSELDLLHPERLEGTGITAVADSNLTINQTTGHQLGTGAVMRIGGAEYAVSHVGITGFMERLSQLYGRQVDGMLGAGLMRAFLIEWDVSHQELVLRDPEEEIEGAPIRQDRARVFVPVTLQSEGLEFTGEFLLDTGYNKTLSVDRGWLEAQGISVNNFGTVNNKSVRFGSEGRVVAGRFPAVTVGGVTFEDVIVEVSDHGDIDGRGSGLLGFEVLSRLRTVLDVSEGEVKFEANESADEEFRFDQSGLGISAQGPGLDRLLIEYVRPGSPGAEAGVEEGDEILAVNGRAAGEWKLWELRRLLREETGARVELVLLRNGVELRKEIVLKEML